MTQRNTEITQKHKIPFFSFSMFHIDSIIILYFNHKTIQMMEVKATWPPTTKRCLSELSYNYFILELCLCTYVFFPYICLYSYFLKVCPRIWVNQVKQKN